MMFITIFVFYLTATFQPEMESCNTGLGLESGFFHDANFLATASDSKDTSAKYARLNNESAWCVPTHHLHKDRHFLQVISFICYTLTFITNVPHPRGALQSFVYIT